MPWRNFGLVFFPSCPWQGCGCMYVIPCTLLAERMPRSRLLMSFHAETTSNIMEKTTKITLKDEINIYHNLKKKYTLEPNLQISNLSKQSLNDRIHLWFTCFPYLWFLVILAWKDSSVAVGIIKTELSMKTCVIVEFILKTYWKI